MLNNTFPPTSTLRICFLMLGLLGIFSLSNAIPCQLHGVSLFLSPPIVYSSHGYGENTFCVNHGRWLPNSKSVSTFSASNSPSSPLSFQSQICIQDGHIILLANGYSGPNDPVHGDVFSVTSNGVSMGSGHKVTFSDWNPSVQGNQKACTNDAAAYVNVTNILGFGNALEDPQPTSSIEITVNSSTHSCDARTYYVQLQNRACNHGDSPKCMFNRFEVLEYGIDHNDAVNHPLIQITGGSLKANGGSPFASNIAAGHNVGQNYIYISAETGEATYTLYSIQHLTVINNLLTDEWFTFTSYVQYPYVFDGSEPDNLGFRVPWNPNGVNRYIFNFSAIQSQGECGTHNLIYDFAPSGIPLDFEYPTVSFSSSSTGTNAGGAGDPQFTGLRGQSFQIHGYDGAVFNIISNPQFQLNSLFVFLSGPRPCPILPSGQKSVACWSHDGSYLGDLGFKTNMNDQIYVKPGSAESGFAQVMFNNRSMEVGESIEFTYVNGEDMKLPTSMNTGRIQLTSTHELSIEISSFSMEIENVDSFVNLRRLSIPAAYRSTLSTLRPHGLLGQTWQLKRYKGMVKEIEGDVDDYVVEDGLFGNHFMFNRFSIQ